MNFPNWLRVYGDTSYRGQCPTETMEQSTFFNNLPPHLKKVALHIKNEGRRSAMQMAKQKAAGGFIKGASDCILPGSPTLVIEMKRKDHSQSTWQAGQQQYLEACQDLGCFACVALGWEAALEAVHAWDNKC